MIIGKFISRYDGAFYDTLIKYKVIFSTLENWFLIEDVIYNNDILDNLIKTCEKVEVDSDSKDVLGWRPWTISRRYDNDPTIKFSFFVKGRAHITGAPNFETALEFSKYAEGFKFYNPFLSMKENIEWL